MKTIVLPAGTEHVQFGELARRIADALWPSNGEDDESMDCAIACIRLESELADAVKSGAMPVKDAMTFGPHPYTVGNALRTALVTVDDLQRFVSDRGLSVIVETTEPQQTAPAVPMVNAKGTKKNPKTIEFENAVLGEMTNVWNQWKFNKAGNAKLKEPTKGEMHAQVFNVLGTRGIKSANKSPSLQMVCDAAKPWKKPAPMPVQVSPSVAPTKRPAFKGER